MRNLCPYGHMHAKLVPSHMMPDACLTAWLHVFGFLFLPMLSAHSQAKNRLCGDGTLALCLWIAERRMTQEALAVHECTSAFDTSQRMRTMTTSCSISAPICLDGLCFGQGYTQCCVTGTSVYFLGSRPLWRVCSANLSYKSTTSSLPRKKRSRSKGGCCPKNSTRAPAALSRSCWQVWFCGLLWWLWMMSLCSDRIIMWDYPNSQHS